MALPRFMALQTNDKNEALGYIDDGSANYGYLSFIQSQSVSPLTKFEVVNASNGGGLIHIRSSQNNKYWARTKDHCSDNYWITATADTPEEDQSKETCTLFSPISVDPSANTVRFVHVQSGCYLYTWPWLNTRCVLANFKSADANNRDLLKVVDWSSLLVLPRYVAFKGDNNQYLCVRDFNHHPFHQFGTGNIADPTASFEIFAYQDGIVRIRPTSSNFFWRLSPGWIWADSNDNTTNNKDTLFRPVKVNDTTIALLSLGLNRFCRRLTRDGLTNCLNANPDYVTGDSYLVVEEPILTRRIENARYNLKNSRVYDERVLLVATNVATNFSQQPTTLAVKLSYTDTKTSIWNTVFSLKLPMKATYDFEVPLINEGNVQLSGERQAVSEWGEIKTTAKTVEVVHQVVVPPRTNMTVNLFATIGKCEVPFTFTQTDTFHNGRVVTTEIQGNVYTGSNYYNLRFETKEERLTA